MIKLLAYYDVDKDKSNVVLLAFYKLNYVIDSIVDCDDVEGLQHGIEKICVKNLFSTADCIEQAKQFDMNKRFQEYIDLYKEGCKK